MTLVRPVNRGEVQSKVWEKLSPAAEYQYNCPMSGDMWVALAILVFSILFFITEWLRVDVVALIVVVALMLSGLLTNEEALSGFANPVVLTIAALFVVGGAVMQTGLAETIGRGILRISGKDVSRLTFFIMLTVGLISGFISNTGTVAVLLPAIIRLARKTDISPSCLLLPMAYGSSLGGALTLIGTPPNLIVSALLRDQGLPAFGFFDFTPAGLLVFVTGVIFILLAGKRLFPDRKPDIGRTETGARKLLPDLESSGQVARLRVAPASLLVGKTITEAQLRQQFGVNVLDILPPPADPPTTWQKVAAFIKPGKKSLTAAPVQGQRINPGDVLLIQGKETEIERLVNTWGLHHDHSAEQPASSTSRESGLAEVLLLPYSQLEGKDLIESQFGSRYAVNVLSIDRPGVSEPLPLRSSSLRFGDTLLVQGPRHAIQALRGQSRDFVVLSEQIEVETPAEKRKAITTLLILAAMMISLVSGVLSIAPASMLAALAVILTGCLSIDDAYKSIDWKSIVLIAGMLPMSIALEKVGLVNVVANGLVNSLGALGPLWVMAGFFLLTSFFTQVLSNTATTVLVAPIALIAAVKLGVQPQAFLMAVALAASMAFATPVSSPVNTLVMGAGNYRFSDYVKAGVPLILVCMVVAMLALPVFWPF